MPQRFQEATTTVDSKMPSRRSVSGATTGEPLRAAKKRLINGSNGSSGHLRATSIPAPQLRHADAGLRVEFGYRAKRQQPEGNLGGTTRKTALRTTQKTTQKISAILKQDPSASRREIAATLGDITEDGVKYHLDRLKSEGRIRRIGPARGGEWQIVGEDEED